MNLLRTSLLAALILALSATAASAVPTTIDASFGDEGLAWVTVVPNLPSHEFSVGNAIELPGGGYASVDERCADDDCETIVTRIDADGQPVSGFGAAGVASIAHGTYRFIGKDIAQTDSGDLLVVGYAQDSGSGEQNFASALIDGDTGAPVMSHGSDGIDIWGDWNSLNSIIRVKNAGAGLGLMAIANGEVVDQQQSLLLHFDVDGANDSSQAIGGPGGSNFLAFDFLLQSPNLYLAGLHVDNSSAQPAVAKLASGSFDTTWSADGVAPVSSSGFGAAFSIDFAAGGGVVAAGSVAPGLSSPVGFVSKLDPNGELDDGFGTAGTTECTPPSGGHCQFTSVDVASDGRVVAGGSVTDTAPSVSSLIMRLSAAGGRDDAFVDGGEYVFTAGLGSDQLRPVFAATGSKIVFRTAAVRDDGADGLAGAAFGRLEGGDIPEPPTPPTPETPEPPTPPTPDDEALSIKITTKSKLKASKFKAVTGVAGGTGLVRVELAIQRVDTKLLKKSNKCLYLKNQRGAFGVVGARGGKCLPVRALRAKGTTSWSYKFSKALKPGKYVISARPVNDDEGRIVTRKLTLTK